MIASCQTAELTFQTILDMKRDGSVLQNLIQTDSVTVSERESRWLDGWREEGSGMGKTNSSLSIASCPLHVFNKSLWKYHQGVKSLWKQTLFTEPQGSLHYLSLRGSLLKNLSPACVQNC